MSQHKKERFEDKVVRETYPLSIALGWVRSHTNIKEESSPKPESSIIDEEISFQVFKDEFLSSTENKSKAKELFVKYLEFRERKKEAVTDTLIGTIDYIKNSKG